MDERRRSLPVAPMAPPPRGLSRRRFLARGALGGAGLATAALIGCFGDDDDDASPTATATSTAAPTAAREPGGTATPAASATPAGAAPRRGGTLRLRASRSPSTLDPLRTTDPATRTPAAAVYGTLFRQALTTFEDTPSAEFPGFLASTSELTPDGLTLTVTLQEAARFVPPGPGAVQPSAQLDRAVDSEDVAFSIDRFRGRAGHDAAPNAAQLAFIEAVETPDAQTVVLRFDQALARAIWRLADVSNLLIMPRETGTAFDPAETMVGSGPFRWNGGRPDEGYALLRNDGWWGGPHAPYLDGIEWTVEDAAAQVARFVGGELDVVEALRPDQVLALRADFPAAEVFPRKLLGFGYLARGEPRDGSAAHDDARVRRAISLALDRDALNEAAYEIAALTDVGFAMAELVGWHNVLPAGYAGQSLDPRVDAATGALVRRDRGEARKLLAAAGVGDDFALPLHYTTAYGSAWQREAALIPEQLAEVGIALTPTIDEFETTYSDQTFRGDFEGLAFQLQAFADLGDYLQEMFLPGGIRNHSDVDDPAIVDAAAAIATTLDGAERNERMHAIQRELLADPMWYVPAVGWQLGWAAWHPRLRGAGARRHGNGRDGEVLAGYPRWWIDQA